MGWRLGASLSLLLALAFCGQRLRFPWRIQERRGRWALNLLQPLQQEFLPSEHVPATEALFACLPCLCTLPVGVLGRFQRPSGLGLPFLPGTTTDAPSENTVSTACPTATCCGR